MTDEELRQKIAVAREAQQKLREELTQKFPITPEQLAEIKRRETVEKELEKQQMTTEMNAQGTDSVCCPRCGSTQLTANKKGFGLGKAAAGGLLLGPVGLLGGFLGSNKVLITCLKCGHQWKP